MESEKREELNTRHLLNGVIRSDVYGLSNKLNRNGDGIDGREIERIRDDYIRRLRLLPKEEGYITYEILGEFLELGLIIDWTSIEDLKRIMKKYEELVYQKFPRSPVLAYE